MHVKVVWDNLEKTVIRLQFSNGWTWEEFHDALEIAKLMALSVPHRVLGLIFDLEFVITHPYYTQRHLDHIVANVHPKIDYVVIVGRSYWCSVVHAVLAQLYDEEYAYIWPLMRTLAEARDFLCAKLGTMISVA